jgi:hypothetical protein
MRLTENQREILKQAAGQLGRPNYGDRHLMLRDITFLAREGYLETGFDDDQPTAWSTPKGDALLAQENSNAE